MNRDQFIQSFNESIDILTQSEVVTKRELKALSRSLVNAIHGVDDELLMGDIQFINRLLTVLTPVNRKVAVRFFEHFSGFHYSEELHSFTKKSKKRAVESRNDSIEFLADPNNNIWSWAERHIEVEVKPFNTLKVTKFIEGALKKLEGNEVEVLKAVLAAGISIDSVITVMEEMDGVEVNVNEE